MPLRLATRRPFRTSYLTGLLLVGLLGGGMDDWAVAENDSLAREPLAAETAESIRAEWQAVRAESKSSKAFSSGAGLQLFVAPNPYATLPKAKHPTDRPLAKQLAALAQRAAALGEASLAMQLATEALRHDPDCELARYALGYTHYQDEWLTPYQLRMAERGRYWNEQFGWIEPNDLPRYEAGERKYRRRWITAEVDARLHSDLAQGWQVRTDHFNVTTNHSLAAGAQLAAKLEQLYQVWQQACGDFHLDRVDLQRRFEKGQAPGVQARPFQVVYYRTQADYNTALLSRQPRIAETLGIYFARQRESHFFATPASNSNDSNSNDAQANDPTLYHEAVHQLFQESRPRSAAGQRRAVRKNTGRAEVGSHDNFWAVEGIATWFESLRWHPSPDATTPGCFTLGEPNAGRLPAARQRLLADGYRVPLAELVLLGQHDLQTRTDLAPLYSQSAGLATFFMSEPPRRAKFVEYLRLLYLGQAEPSSLASLTGKTYAQLDSEYHHFLEQLP